MSKMKKVIVSKRGYINMRLFYDAFIEIEVPEEMDDNDVEDYVDENEELSNKLHQAFREEIDGIYAELDKTNLEYDENGGYDEINVDRVEEEDGDTEE